MAPENINLYLNIYVVYDAFVQVVAIEAVMSVIGMFALNNVTWVHMKKCIPFVGDTDHYAYSGRIFWNWKQTRCLSFRRRSRKM